MTCQIDIARINPSDSRLDHLAAEARAEGYTFVDRLLSDARSGENRFDRQGELFCGAFLASGLVGCGGVNIDPYAGRDVGRLRHVFVCGDARRAGVATTLVRYLLRQSRHSFSIVRLRTPDRRAGRFYEALGFSPTNETLATHVFRF